MNRFMKKIAAAAASCAIACSAIAPVAVSADETFDELDQQQFTEAMGLGWNLGNTYEATLNDGKPNPTVWGNEPVTDDIVKMVKNAGFSSIRMPVGWLDMIGEGPDYTIDEEWLQQIHQAVDIIVSNDMYVIVNMHSDGYHSINGAWLFCDADDEAQVEIQAKYKAVWEQIANELAEYDEHLIFESMNEEFDGTYTVPKKAAYANINTYNQIFVDTIRSTGGNNARRWLLVPGWNTNINYTTRAAYGFKIPEDTLCEADGNRIAISVHYYAPDDFAFGESNNKVTRWGKYAAEEDKDSWGQEDYMEEQIGKVKTAFVDNGYPVIVGEFAAANKEHMDEMNPEFRRYWGEYFVKTCHESGVIPVYWDMGYTGKNGMCLFDRKNLVATQQGMIDGMMRAINAEGDYEIPPVILDEEDSSSETETESSEITEDSSSETETSSSAESSSSSAAESSKAAASSSKAASGTTTTNPVTGSAIAFTGIALSCAAIAVSRRKK